MLSVRLQVLMAVRMHIATAGQDAVLLLTVSDGSSTQFLVKAVPTSLLLVRQAIFFDVGCALKFKIITYRQPLHARH